MVKKQTKSIRQNFSLDGVLPLWLTYQNAGGLVF